MLRQDEVRAELHATVEKTSQVKKENVALHKEMLSMLQLESDRRAGLADWYAQTGSLFCTTYTACTACTVSLSLCHCV